MVIMFQHWEMLGVLYETGNITQAAKQLFVSQPTLTTRIKHLEEHYDIQLIVRKHRGIDFTPEGEELAMHAKKMLREQIYIEEKLNNMKNNVTGKLRVGVSHFFALNKMPKILRLFKQLYPEVEFQVITGWSSDIYQRALNNDVHLSFIKGNYSWKEEKVLLYEEEVCIASPWEFTLEDLPKLPRIDYNTDGQNKIIMDNWWYNQFDKSPNVNIHVNQVETCKEMVVNGLGYAILADLVVRPHDELFTKTLYEPSGEAIKRNTWMYYHKDSIQMNIVKAFVQFVQTLDIKQL